MELDRQKTVYEHFIKRPLDILLSLVALVFFSPELLVIAIIVRVKLGSPVLFTQERPGLNEKIFKIYKFRTMTNSTDHQGQLLSDGERLTSLGRFHGFSFLTNR